VHPLGLPPYRKWRGRLFVWFDKKYDVPRYLPLFRLGPPGWNAAMIMGTTRAARQSCLSQTHRGKSNMRILATSVFRSPGSWPSNIPRLLVSFPKFTLPGTLNPHNDISKLPRPRWLSVTLAVSLGAKA
jgi:hypothetical protein